MAAIITISIVVLVTSMLSGNSVYLSNFLKFGVLSTLGELIGVSIKSRKIRMIDKFFQKVIVWGFIGMLITIAFPLFISGVEGLQSQDLLPKFQGNPLAISFMGSIAMNFTFGPMMMLFHKILDIDLELNSKVDNRLTVIIQDINWNSLVKDTWIKTTLCFWIPIHTIVFLLPETIRIIVAAILSTALGILLSVGDSKKKASNGKGLINEDVN